MNHTPAVAIIDDDPMTLRLTEAILQSDGLTVASFTGAAEFLAWIAENTCDCILLDINMPDMSGDDLQVRLLDMSIAVPVLFLTSEADVSVASALFHRGAMDVILKPIDPLTLIPKVRHAIAVTAAARS